MREICDISFGPGKTDLLDLYLPDQGPFDTLIWFHGGGLEKGNRKNPHFAEQLTEQGIGVVSVEYRLLPEAAFPDFVVDGAAGVRWALEHIYEYGAGEGTKFYVSGQSAGAYMTLLLALDEHYFRDAGVDQNRITAYISDSAQITVHYNVLKARGMDSRLERIDEAAPLYFLNSESRFGHLLLLAYEEDIPCRLEQNMLFYQDIKRICPEQHVEFVKLQGRHCNGSSHLNERGTYDYNDQLICFVRGIAKQEEE